MLFFLYNSAESKKCPSDITPHNYILDEKSHSYYCNTRFYNLFAWHQWESFYYGNENRIFSL